MRWRGGAAHTPEGAAKWLRAQVGRLRQRGITDLMVRLDKGFFSRAMVEQLRELDVAFVLKVPHHRWVRSHLGAYRQSEKDPELWTAVGELYGARLCSVERRVTARLEAALSPTQTALALDTYEVGSGGVAQVLTNLRWGVHADTAWRRHNAGVVVEQGINKCYQLCFGRTAIDDVESNAILAGL